MKIVINGDNTLFVSWGDGGSGIVVSKIYYQGQKIWPQD